jgi:D-psicose/D-tagatose/L-ribulose 3-epimerase
MKYSMHNWMRPEPIEVTLERLHRLGYDGIEISGEPERFDTTAIGRMLQNYGLVCWGAVTIMTEGRDLAAEDRYVRLATISYIKDCVRMVHELHGSILTTVPATVGKIKPAASARQEWKWVVDALDEIADYAGEQQVRLAIEPINRFETYLINRHDQAIELADAIGRGTGVALDSFHINIEEEDPMGAIRATGDRLLDFHIADTNRKPPGMGQYDWKKVLNTLRETGYQGHLTVEFCLPVDRSPLAWSSESAEAEAVAAAEESADEAQMKFIRDHGSGWISAEDYDRAVEQSIQHLRQC